MATAEFPCIREALEVRVSSMLYLGTCLDEHGCAQLADQIVEMLAAIPAEMLACALSAAPGAVPAGTAPEAASVAAPAAPTAPIVEAVAA